VGAVEPDPWAGKITAATVGLDHISGNLAATPTDIAAKSLRREFCIFCLDFDTTHSDWFKDQRIAWGWPVVISFDRYTESLAYSENIPLSLLDLQGMVVAAPAGWAGRDVLAINPQARRLAALNGPRRPGYGLGIFKRREFNLIRTITTVP